MRLACIRESVRHDEDQKRQGCWHKMNGLAGCRLSTRCGRSIHPRRIEVLWGDRLSSVPTSRKSIRIVLLQLRPPRQASLPKLLPFMTLEISTLARVSLERRENCFELNSPDLDRGGNSCER